jgi:hypothetical protein
MEKERTNCVFGDMNTSVLQPYQSHAASVQV